jgi:hypothetical protein
MGSSRGLLGVRTRGGIPRRVEWGREGGLLQGDRATPYLCRLHYSTRRLLVIVIITRVTTSKTPSALGVYYDSH